MSEASYCSEGSIRSLTTFLRSVLEYAVWQAEGSLEGLVPGETLTLEANPVEGTGLSRPDR